MVPIPGTKRVKYLEDNVGAVHVTLDEGDLREIDEACEEFQVAGERYTKDMGHLFARRKRTVLDVCRSASRLVQTGSACP